MPSLDEIKYFLNVVRTKNISRAAELSGLSQPALSHAIKRLETELNMPLLVREKTGVHLTKAGELFAAKSKELIEKWEDVSRSLRSNDESVSGHFRLGCHPSVGIYTLPKFLKKLLAENPQLELSLHHGRSRDIANEVIEWRVDFGLVINPPEHPDLVIKELAKDEVTLWVSSDRHLEDTLIVESGLFQSQDILQQLKKRKMHFARTIESANLEVIQSLTAAGCGVGILPTRVAQSSSKTLKKYSSHAPVFKDRLCLIYRSGMQYSMAARQIIDAVIEADI